jgi:hypothetical protein
MNDAYIRALPAEVQTQLAAQSVYLVETSIPDSLSAEAQAQVSQVIREAFTATFNILMIIGAVACALCAIAAFFTIDDRELKRKRGQDILDESDAASDAAGATASTVLLGKPPRESP